MMGRTGLTRVLKGEDGCTLVTSLARQKMNISVILPLIEYEVLRQTEYLTDVSLPTEDVSMPSSVHIHCYASKCASNAFPLMFLFQNLCQAIQSIFFPVLMHSLREYKV